MSKMDYLKQIHQKVSGNKKGEKKISSFLMTYHDS